MCSMSQRARWFSSAGLAGVTVIVLRLVASNGRSDYAIWPDEPAQLAIARFVGGGTRWDMHNHSVWRPLYGTLLSPVYWFTDDPTTVFATALVLNAMLGGVAAVLLVVLARRLTALGSWWCALLAVLASASPALLFTTDFVFSESLLVVLYLATLLALLRFQRAPTLAMGVVAGVLAGAAFGTHSRMLPLGIIVVGAAAVASYQRRLAARDGLAVGLVAFASLYAMSVYTSYLVDRLWNEPSTRNSIDGVLGQFGNIPAILVSLFGQSWSLLVSTLGIIAYGLVVVVRNARPATDGHDRDGPSVNDARIVLVSFLACAGLSVVFMSDRWRSDQLVYGRYNAAVVAPLLIVGLATLMGSIRTRRFALMVAVAAVATVASGAVIWMWRRSELSESNGLAPMILGLQPFITSETRIDVVRITAWATGIIVLLGAGSIALHQHARRRKAVLVAVVGALVVTGSLRTHHTIDRLWNASDDFRAVEALQGDVLIDNVDYFLPAGSNSTTALMRYQFHLPHITFTIVSDPLAGASAPYVFAPIDQADVAGSGARLVWRDPRTEIGLWQR